MKRAAGILLHVSSLPGPYGVGTLGQEAFRYVDFLAEAGIRYWQILPLCPVGPSNSPYSSVSIFANCELYIDPRPLAAEGYLTRAELADLAYAGERDKADFAFARKNSNFYLRRAFARMNEDRHRELLAFVNAESRWLVDYALYVVLHERFAGERWQDWPEAYAWRDEQTLAEFSLRPENMHELEFVYFCQWQFRRQWDRLKAYAHRLNVKLIGDMPIFPALDSADVWSAPEQFQLDKKGLPTAKAGVPPDYFSEDGQLWGNPLYDWEHIEEEDFAWWVDRVRYAMTLYDVVRIDHFRGFESYWSVPAESETARHGVWRRGPGMKLFNRLHEEIENVEIIAENLGNINEEVDKLLKDSGYPGMKVLQFAFDDMEWAKELPYTYVENDVVYTGTHDNNTIVGWLQDRPDNIRRFALDYVRLPEAEGLSKTEVARLGAKAFIETAWATPCILAVAPLQDFLALDETRRMNTPGTDTALNWIFRVRQEELATLDPKRIYRLNQVFQRLH